MSIIDIENDSEKCNDPRNYTRVRGFVQGGLNVGYPDLPLGCPDNILLIVGESPEQRAFRRFPIKSHKPGP